MSFTAKEREKKGNVQNQDKQTPYTVLQKLSPKPLRTPWNLHKKVEKVKKKAHIMFYLACSIRR